MNVKKLTVRIIENTALGTAELSRPARIDIDRGNNTTRSNILRIHGLINAAGVITQTTTPENSDDRLAVVRVIRALNNTCEYKQLLKPTAKPKHRKLKISLYGISL